MPLWGSVTREAFDWYGELEVSELSGALPGPEARSKTVCCWLLIREEGRDVLNNGTNQRWSLLADGWENVIRIGSPSTDRTFLLRFHTEDEPEKDVQAAD